MKDHGRIEELKHQGSDVPIRMVMAAVIAFVVIGAGIFTGVWWLYRYNAGIEAGRDVRRTFVETKPPVPPEPRLQVSPSGDFQEYFRKQQETLNSYGSSLIEDGKVRIPIERAMQLIVEREKQK